MDNAAYTTLSRQTGLKRSLQAVAHNIANISTTGYRREDVIFAEHVRALGRSGDALALTHATVRHASQAQGPLEQTGGSFDFAIDGEGFFTVETPQGLRLTRAGSFMPDAAGDLVSPLGHRLLDEAGAPVFVPPDAREVALAGDGTLSADGVPLARLGAAIPAGPLPPRREAGVLFDPGADGVAPLPEPRLRQGFLEGSNVEPVAEIARMIEVQRSYELGQNLLDREDERIRNVIQTLGR